MGIFDFLKGKDEGLGLDELSRRMGIEASLLESLKPGYREFQVPKRSGGARVLHAPGPKLKDIQKLILRRVLHRLRCHSAAHGFERGRSVASNALPHVARAVVLRMDIRDFFPSTSAKRVEKYFVSVGWSRKAAKLLTTLTTWKGGLPQGAPTSPRLSNLLNYKLDQRLAGLACFSGAVYTRYADDLTFSFELDSGLTIRSFCHTVREIAKREGGYEVYSRKKLRISRRHQSQRVTGVVVNERPRLPREIRRRLRAIEHQLDTRGTASLTREQLAGWRAYERMIEGAGSPV